MHAGHNTSQHGAGRAVEHARPRVLVVLVGIAKWRSEQGVRARIVAFGVADPRIQARGLARARAEAVGVALGPGIDPGMNPGMDPEAWFGANHRPFVGTSTALHVIAQASLPHRPMMWDIMSARLPASLLEPVGYPDFRDLEAARRPSEIDVLRK